MVAVLATNNVHKKEEIQQILPDFIILKTLEDIDFTDEIEETGTTFHENALIKAKQVFDFCKLPVFADDSGLVIQALNGEPGIYSARYAKSGIFADNIQKVLEKLNGKTNRNAYFVCVICWYNGKKPIYFEGKIHGTISENIQGENGFGYDPIFIPEGYEMSFAQLSSSEKNKISHRAKALQYFINALINNKLS